MVVRGSVNSWVRGCRRRRLVNKWSDVRSPTNDKRVIGVLLRLDRFGQLKRGWGTGFVLSLFHTWGSSTGKNPLEGVGIPWYIS